MGTAVLAVAAIAVVTVVAITGAFSARDSSTADVPPPQDSSAPLHSDATPEAPLPTAGALDAPVIESAAPAVTCDDPAVIAALAEGTDADVIAAFGGGGPFRARVASGEAPCVNLTEPGRTWIVVNKQFGITEPGYLPELVYAEGARNTVDGELRADVDAALAEMNAASIAEGAGELGIASAARADWFQQRLHDNDAASNGLESADESTARAGHSEHQTGLAVDLIACDGGCGTIEGFGDSPQGRWVAVNAWRFGFIVRYEDGFTGTTGYMPEPWHLRYIGLELAHAYAEGGYRTLEDFFGLPAAPDYVD
ncbi:hypothetical protein AOA12_20990 [Microbacterium sp. No. 7]|nr:hypothetical protein AOA12_20990 [Microbacterium sp. No. 7]